MSRHATRLALAAVLAAGALFATAVLLAPTPAHADEGWTIDRFASVIVVQPDGGLAITETTAVDFGPLEKHGIFREIPVEYDYDGSHNRIYRFKALSVTDAAGTRWPYEQGRNGANVRLKIGDADRTVSGKQTYVIAYRIEGALNAFPDHDELYWNVNGPDWPVSTSEVSATVSVPGGKYTGISCFQGDTGSSEPCLSTIPASREGAHFVSRPLRSGGQLTVVAGIPKGAVAEPQVLLVDKPKNAFEQNFRFAPWIIVATILASLGAVAGLVAYWWRSGRDRVYTSIYYLSQNPEERTRPMLYRDQIVVEYTPPDQLRPAQMGLLLDESADTKDVTATIVDLAVRGYLKIEEKEKAWVFGKKDWHLTKLKEGADLQPFERTILDGLFEGSDAVDVSDLKAKYVDTLKTAEAELYADATGRGWFARSPTSARTGSVIAGVVVVAAGAGAGALFGREWGAALIASPVVVAGALLVLGSRWMVRRTARGSEALRRVLGFRLYIDTAEKDRQRFNEQANIFAAYLPYAIVFGSVEKWARAFRDIDTAAATQGWYAGPGPFSAPAFSDSLSSFSSSVSSVIASTPASSGSSGFGGGGAGGGGGGGGGGSW